MSEEMNKELETEVIAGVTAEEPVETMEDFAAELEASYKTLNKRKYAHSSRPPSCLQSMWRNWKTGRAGMWSV